LEEVESLIGQQQNMIKQLEGQRTTIVSLLQKGKDLQKDPHSTKFIPDHIQELEKTWSETYGHANEKLRQLKGTQKVWLEYRSQRDDIMLLLEQAEDELKKIVPKHDPKLVAADLRAKQDMSVALREATENMLKRLRDLAQSLGEVSGPDKQPVFEKEVEEIEERLKSMLDLLDDKVRNLGQYNEKWNDLAEKIDDMKSWMKGAQKMLQQLLSSDMSPEERLKRTKELQDQIADRMKMLKIIENEAQELLKAEGADGQPIEGKIVMDQVDSLKEELVCLHETVSVQSAQTVEAVQAWEECRADLEKVNPWLEEADVKVAMGWGRPTTLQDAHKIAQELAKFSSECQTQQAKLAEASRRSEKIGKMTAAQDEVDVTMTKWATVNSAVTQSKEKSDHLVKNWEKYEKLFVEFESWLTAAEQSVQKPLDRKTLNVAQLETALAQLKNLNKEISEHQSKIISLTNECDGVSQNLSSEGVSILNSNLGNLKSRMLGLGNEVRGKMNYLSDSIIARQEFDAKLTDFQQWMDEFSASQEQTDVYFNKIDAALQQIHVSIQEHAERLSQFREIDEDVKIYHMKPDTTSSFEEVGKNLLLCKESLSAWNQLASWVLESTSAVEYCTKQLQTPGLKKNKIHEIEQAIDNLSEKCEEWIPKAIELDNQGTTCSLNVLDPKTSMPLSAEALVHEIKNKLNRAQKSSVAVLEETEKMGSQLDKLKALDTELKKYYRSTEEELSQLKPEQNDLVSVQRMKDKLQGLVEKHAQMESLKSNVQKLGSDLIRADPSNSTEFQNMIQSADTDYHKLQSQMNDKWTNLVDIMDLWSRYNDSKETVTKMLKEGAELSSSALKGVPSDSISATALLDHLKKCNEVLAKKKTVVDNCNSLNQQLCTALEPLPQFDTTELNGETVSLRNSYVKLVKSISEHIPKLETQLLLWRTVESSKDELMKWLSDTYSSLEETQTGLCNSDLAKMKLGQYKDEVGDKYNMKMSVQSKANQLKKMNAGSSIPNLDSILELVEEGFIELDKLSKDLEKSLGSFEDKEVALKNAMKQNTDSLVKLKEKITKCEDRSGTPSDVLSRLNTLKQARTDCTELKPLIEAAEGQITVLKEEYPSWDNSMMLNDLKTQKKRHGICENQINMVNSALTAVLEKNFQDKYISVARIVHALVEKIKWCDPSSISDSFSLESKKSALTDVDDGISESHEKLPLVQDAFSVLQQIPNFGKLQEHGDHLNSILNDLMIVEKNHKRMKDDFDEFSSLWSSFEASSDEINAWLKDFEGVVRGESLSQISLTELPEKAKEAETFAKDIKECEGKLQQLEAVSANIVRISPEARSPQVVAQLTNRLQAITKFAKALKDKVAELENSKKQYDAALMKAKSWIDDNNKELKSLDDPKGTKSTMTSQAKLEKLKEISSSTGGLDLLNQAVASGEAIVPGITPDSKEAVRQDLRDLRNKWEAHLDLGNALTKKLEALQMQWSSFDDSVTQLEGWFDDAKKKADNLDDLQVNLPDKKSTLQVRRTLLQDMSSHAEVINSLKNKMKEFSDEEASSKLNKFGQDYESLREKAQAAVHKSESHVTEHEKLDFVTENFKEWLKRLQGEVSVIMEEPLSEKSDSESRLATLDQLLQYKSEGEMQIQKCEEQLKIVLPQTHPSGHPPLKQALQNLKYDWEGFLEHCKTTKDRIEKEYGKLSVVQKQVEDLSAWLKQKEFQVKDPSFKSTVEAKSFHLTKLEELQGEIKQKEPEFAQLGESMRAIPGETELQTHVAHMSSRYQGLTQPLNDLINRYKVFLNDHETFNISHAEFLRWIDGGKKNCKELGEIVGDMAVLQERRQQLSNLMDTRNAKTPEMESLVESGEKLYSHTSPDGREIIRQQIRTVRDGWETLGEQMQSSWQKLDACLSQFSDFTTSQEELTKWLKGIEKSMQIHTQLKATLQEKKAQLQNHKIVNQEIASHQVLVEAVCEKAQQLVDMTQDSSLQIYITSIKQLFHDIKLKSKDLLEKLEGCVQDHSKLNDSLRDFTDWMNQQKEKLSAVEDLSGEKNDIVRRIEEIQNLKIYSDKGSALLEKVEELAGSVCLSTSEAGTKAIETDVTSARETYDKYICDLETGDQKLQNVLQKWQDFEVGLQRNTKWFREQESVFRAQVLQCTLPEKEESLRNYTAQRQIVTDFEKEVTDFLDQSHFLLQTSNAERIKPLVMQISNRYQLLHVLSKEVVNKWQGIVDDHQTYDSKFSEANDLLSKFEDNFAVVIDEPNMEQRNAKLQVLAAEKEQILHKINVLVQLAEKLYPDTAAPGREQIRQNLRELRERFDKIDESITELQKKQNTESQQWSSYQDNLQQTLVWLTNMEKAAAIDSPNWLSVPDTKSKLMKLKSTLQDAISHKRIVEGVIEKAQALVQSNRGPNPEQVKITIDDINKRYEALLNNMLVSITNIEETLDLMQQWNDLVKKEQDWQKNLWEQLNLCTDYSGGKPALQSRLARVEELQSGISEGQALLDTLGSLLDKLGKKLPPASKETLEKDETNLRYELTQQKRLRFPKKSVCSYYIMNCCRFDFDKLKSGIEEVRHTLQERLQQWNEYEDGFERLLAWLSEAEGTLKTYGNCNTLEEKEEQHAKYQVSFVGLIYMHFILKGFKWVKF
jgi:nesprin-1